MSLAATEADWFLGVAESVSGRGWQLNASDERLGQAIAQQLGVPDVIGRILASRGVALEDAEQFLTPRLRDHLVEIPQLKELDIAVGRIVEAIGGGQKIAVFGDYDVDGATSSALLARYFRALGVPLRIYIPDRIKEGYGPNAPALKALKEEGIDLVITVDCGTTSFEALEAAKKAGLDVIVLDHHKAEEKLPPCVALVNPNRPDEAEEIAAATGKLAAVGIAFLLVVALNSRLERRDINPLNWLDLVALGTICDVMPLVGLNRAFAAQGLKVMSKRANAGLAALADVAGLSEAPTAYHAGFLLGPRVNAGGRVGKAGLGAELLATDNPSRAREIATQLDIYNEERKVIEAEVLADARVRVETDFAADPVLVVDGEGWHEGVIGIVASRLKEKYGRPTFVLARDGELAKGSGRSVPGVDMGQAVTIAKQKGLLVNGGGHAMAAGLTVAVDRIGELRDVLNAQLGAKLAEIAARPVLRLDGILTPRAANADMVAVLEQAGPFGAGHPQPRFALPSVNLVKADVVGENHVRCILSGRDGGRLKAIAFRALDEPLGQLLLQAGKSGWPLHLAGTLRADRWMGREEAQLFIDDAARA